MTFNEWNNLLGDQLFKPKRKDQEVFMFLTKEQAIQAGWEASQIPGSFDPDEEEGEKLDDEYIWRSFLGCIKSGPNGSGGRGVTLLQRAYNSFSLWKRMRTGGDLPGSRLFSQNGETHIVRYPLHLPYLLLFTMPFGSGGSHITTNGYYESLNNWLLSHTLIAPDAKLDRSALNSVGGDGGWQEMWQAVGYWSSEICKGQIGLVRNRANNWPNWPYVGWPVAQCLLPHTMLSRLPLFFGRNNLLPGSCIESDRIRRLLLSDTGGLGLPAVTQQELQRNSELGQAVSDIVLNVLGRWTGITNRRERVELAGGHVQTVERRGDTYANLLPFLPEWINDIEEVSWHYRLNIKTALPYDLTLTGPGLNCVSVQPETNEWSREIPGVVPNTTAQVFRDPANCWKAIAQISEVQIFVPGARYGFHQWWVPVRVLEHGTPLLVLCQQQHTDTVYGWRAAAGSGGFIDWSHFGGVPHGYSLFWIKSLPQDATGLPGTEVMTESRVETEGGLDCGNRTYLDELPPAFRIINGQPGWRPLLVYSAGGPALALLPDARDGGLWHLPQQVCKGERFRVVVEGEQGIASLPHSLVHARLPKTYTAPSRDPYGMRVKEADSILFYNGHSLCGEQSALHQLRQRQLPYVYHFKPGF